jgi:hypothetical protein
LVFALLAGCNPAPEKAASSSASGGATAQSPLLWAGSGVVQSVTAASTDAPLKRIGIRMDDGRILYLDTPSPDFTVGTAVELTDNQQINRF